MEANKTTEREAGAIQLRRGCMMAYTDSVSPRDVQDAVSRGMKRLRLFRAARLLFITQYVGPYYDKRPGELGTAPLNLIFNAIRVLIPNIVMAFPKHTITTPYLAAKNYAELLGL